jgi:hypothetical protein
MMEIMQITPQQFETLLPLACQWAEEQERIILRTGIPLSSPQITDAELIGIACPDRIRLLGVPRIPMPEHPLLREAASATQLNLTKYWRLDAEIRHLDSSRLLGRPEVGLSRACSHFVV